MHSIQQLVTCYGLKVCFRAGKQSFPARFTFYIRVPDMQHVKCTSVLVEANLFAPAFTILHLALPHLYFTAGW